MTSYVVGLPYGPEGVATGYSLAMTLWVVPHLAWCIHGTPVKLKDILLVVSRPAISGIIAGLVAAGAIHSFSEYLAPLGRLLVGIPVLFLVYVGVLFYGLGQKSYYVQIARGLAKRTPESGTGAGAP